MKNRAEILIRRCFPVFAIGAFFAWTVPARGGIDNLRDALKPLAQSIVDVVQNDLKQPAIAVGDFNAPPGFDANAGPGISESLTSAINELSPGFVQKRASLSLRGRYDKSKDPRNSDLVIIKVTAEITDSNGDLKDQKIAEIKDTGLIGVLLGLSVSLPPVATREKRNEELQKAIDKPQFNQSAGDPLSTIIKARPESPFGIEILVTSKDQAPKDAKGWADVPARVPRNDGGEPFVDIKRDEVYAIRVHNNFEFAGEKYDAAVAASVDGIDIFTFSELRDPKTKGPRYTHYIVPAGVSLVPGWHKTNDHSDSFLVTEYGKGAASQQANRSRGNVGIITVRFALAWTGAPPEAEKGTHDASNETGFGPPVKTDLREVERHVGTARDVISVRYSR
jgi:hypothetical protein